MTKQVYWDGYMWCVQINGDFYGREADKRDAEALAYRVICELTGYKKKPVGGCAANTKEQLP